jgi:hypothetical protein
MKKRQKRLLSLLLACALVCVPVTQSMAAASYDAPSIVSGQVLFPGDALINIAEELPVVIDGEAVALETPGAWTNSDTDRVFSAATAEDGTSLQLTTAGYVLVVEHGTSLKKEEGADNTLNHYEFSDDEEPETPQDLAFYQMGETVKLKADDPEDGMEFAKWECDDPSVTIEDENSAETTIVMLDKKVTIKAIYQEIQQETAAPEEVPAEEQPQEMEQGEDTPVVDSEQADAADVVSSEEADQSAPAADQDQADVVIDVPEAVDDVITIDDVSEETQAPASYSLYVTDGSVSDETGVGPYAAGTEVTVRANDYTADALTFDSWSVDSLNVELTDLHSAEITFQMPESDVYLTAHYAQASEEIIELPADEMEAVAETEAVEVQEPQTEETAAPAEETEAISVPVPAEETESLETPAAQETEAPAATEAAAEGEYNAEDDTPAPADVAETYSFTVTGVASAAVGDTALTVGENNSITADAGATVTVTAATAPEGQQFAVWSGTYTNGNSETKTIAFDDANAATTTFTMPASGETVNGMTITANYEAIPTTKYTIKAAGAVVSGATANADGSYTVEEGSQITVTANAAPAGSEFSGWTITDGSGNAVTDINAAAASVTVTVTKDLNFTANYTGVQYSVTVTSGSTNYASTVAGTTVTVTASAAPAGMEFASWTVTSGNASLANASSETTTFTMPAANVALTATYRQKSYTLTVKNGTSDSTKYYMNDEPIISSNYPETGKEFDYWEAVSGNVNFDDEDLWKTSFTMPASDVTVKAVYKDGPSADDNQILDLVAGGEYYTGSTIKFTASGAGMDNEGTNPGDYRYRPTGYQIGNVTGSWQSAPYTTSMAIKAVGEYTLKVNFAREVYDGESWNADGTTDTKTVTFRVVNDTSVATGDDTPVMTIALVAGAALLVFLILLAVLIRRRKRR